MFCEEIRVPGLPGEENVTDGSVDWYEMDWENVETAFWNPKCRSARKIPAPIPILPAVRTTVRNKPTMKRMK